MEIKRLNREAYAGKRFTARYQTKGYYDIHAGSTGFRMEYVPFEAAVEKAFEDEFFGDWLDEPVDNSNNSLYIGLPPSALSFPIR